MKPHILHAFLPLLLLLSLFCTLISGEASSGVENEVKINDDTFQDPLQFGTMKTPFDDARHRIEHAHLMKRLDRKKGSWNANHPRFRLLEALWGYISYKERNMAELERWRGLYKNVNKRQKNILEKSVGYTKKLSEIEERIWENAMLCKSLVADAMLFYGIEQKELDEHIEEARKNKRQADKVSVSMALKHFVRDWSEEGSKERRDAFPCILAVLRGTRAELASTENEEIPVKVLLPGAGLGRLGDEVVDQGGYQVTINEWSTYMNIAYRYLRSHSDVGSSSLYPFIDGLSHHATTADLLRKVDFPDVSLNPSVLLVEGDFTTVFADKEGYYDVIITHFFIDTARNLISYFETIHRLLRRGGYWINFGPLLYGTGPFVQLSLDEIISVVREMGFEFQEIGDECGKVTLKDEKIRGKEAEYGFNGKALTKNAYEAQAWLARKV